MKSKKYLLVIIIFYTLEINDLIIGIYSIFVLICSKESNNNVLKYHTMAT